jgi:hypothetical protein
MKDSEPDGTKQQAAPDLNCSSLTREYSLICYCCFEIYELSHVFE